MDALIIVLAIVLVLAVVAIATWMWLFIDIVDQVAALVRMRVEEQVAMWRIESISRIAQAEQRRVGDKTRPRSVKDE